MFANERHGIISKMIKTDGAVTTSELVSFFKVSIETIRRDLLYMEQQGLLKRVHGGAVSAGEMKSFLTLEKRNEENNAFKRELAKAAANLISEGEIIGIDSGSTTVFFAQELAKKFSKLTVITHSLDIFNILHRHKDFSVILCGGYFNAEENSFYGNLVTDALSSLRADKVFVCPSALSLKSGICDFQPDLYEVQRKLLSIGNKVYILADSSKFEKTALLKMDDMKSEFTYVTDSNLPKNLLKLYKENNITIYGVNDNE